MQLKTLAAAAAAMESSAQENGNTKHKHDNKENIPLSTEEQQSVWKRLKTHHANTDGTLSLQSANHTPVKLMPLPTPRIGSRDCTSKTRQRRSQLQERVLQEQSTPGNIKSQTEREQHQEAQLTALIKRNKETVSSCAQVCALCVIIYIYVLQ